MAGLLARRGVREAQPIDIFGKGTWRFHLRCHCSHPNEHTPNFAVVILAAGQGTRSARTAQGPAPHRRQGLLMHLLDSVGRLGADKSVVVVGKGRDKVEKALDGREGQHCAPAEQMGTAHAVRQAKDALARYEGAVLSFTADTPSSSRDAGAHARSPGRDATRASWCWLPRLSTRSQVRAHHSWRGRPIAKMVEYKDATEEERAVRLAIAA